MNRINVGTLSAAQPFVMGSFIGGYGLPGYGTPIIMGYPLPAYGYSYIPQWYINELRKTEARKQQRSVAPNPSDARSRTKIRAKTRKVTKRSKNEEMLVVNPSPPPPPAPSHPVPVPPGCYSKVKEGKVVVICPDLTTSTADPFAKRIPIMVAKARAKASRLTSRRPMAQSNPFDCISACDKIYNASWQFPDWQDCLDGCRRRMGELAGYPTSFGNGKLGGRALKTRCDQVLELMIGLRQRDQSAARDTRLPLVIRLLKTARTSQERREAIAVARALVADLDNYDGSQRFLSFANLLLVPCSDDAVKLVLQPVIGQRTKVLLCGSNHCCIVERPSDLWRCIREIRAKKPKIKKLNPPPSVAMACPPNQHAVWQQMPDGTRRRICVPKLGDPLPQPQPSIPHRSIPPRLSAIPHWVSNRAV
jgi:hypothetical protein